MTLRLEPFKNTMLDEMLATDHKMWHQNIGKAGRGVGKSDIIDMIHKDGCVCKAAYEDDKMLGFIIFRIERKVYSLKYFCSTNVEATKLMLSRIIAKLNFVGKTKIELIVHEKLTKLQQQLSEAGFKAQKPIVRRCFGDSDGFNFVYDLGELNVSE